jgi:hypothetical protein
LYDNDTMYMQNKAYSILSNQKFISDQQFFGFCITLQLKKKLPQWNISSMRILNQDASLTLLRKRKTTETNLNARRR